MKFRTTRKEIMNGFNHVIKIGNCDAQTLLSALSPCAYTCNRDGWQSDIYDLASLELYGWAISTGYGPFGNVKSNRETVKAYEKTAREIADNNHNWETKKKLLTDLLNSFIQTVKVENGLAKIDETETA